MTPTARTLALLRRSGFLCEVVERWLDIPARMGKPARKVRRDLFRIGDVIAVHAVRRETLLVQCTSRANVASRVQKAKSFPQLQAILSAGWQYQVWGWDDEGQVRRVILSPENLDEVVLPLAKRGGKGKRQRGLFD